jgi:transcriptional regulator with XRE-family HTH domain
MSGKFAIIDELRARRRALGLDLDEVARPCGVDEAKLRDWERGMELPSPDALERWAEALGFRLALLPIEAGARRGITVDWKQRHIAVDGTPVRLTPMEWKVLERLAWSPGRLVTHRQLFKYLYDEERDCRAQATAVRVLINKLRRLLPIRIDAQWGQGYVIDGIPPSRSEAADEGRAGPDRGGSHRSNGSSLLCDAPVAVGSAITARPALPSARQLFAIKEPTVRAAITSPVTRSPCRAEELGVIERFLAERGATHCPDPRTIAQSSYPDLIWDKMKRKWVRPRSQDDVITARR